MNRYTALPTGTFKIASVWLTVLFLSSFAGAEAEEVFTSQEHGFSIAFPVAPTAKETSRQTASGLTRFVRYTAKDKSFRTSLSVVTYSRSAGADNIKAALKVSRNRQVKRLNGKLLSEKPLSIEGHPGQELIIAIGRPGKPRTFRYRVRTYYVQNRQYLMSVIGTEKLALSPRSNRFFDSFALVQTADRPTK